MFNAIGSSNYSSIYQNFSNYGYNNNTSNNSSNNFNVQKTSRTPINYYDVVKLQYTNGGKPSNVKESASTSNIQPYEVKKQGDEVSKLLSDLTTKNPQSPLNKLNAKSSDADAVMFDIKKQSAYAPKEFSVKVEKLAQSQVNANETLKLKGTDRAVNQNESNNPYKFEINVAGKTSKFAIDVKSTDDNSSIQKKIESAINSANIGVNAKVETKDGNSYLSVTGGKTGAVNAFTIKDVANDKGQSGLAAAMGITNTSKTASDAAYRVGNANGENMSAVRTSASNTVDLLNNVSATFKKETAEPVKASFQKDAKAGIEAVKNFAASLNETLETARSEGGKGYKRLASDIAGMNKSYSRSLEKVGINVSSDGSLQIDEKALKKAAESGKLEDLFQDKFGFANRASNISKNMQSGSLYSNPAASSSSYNKSGNSSSYGGYQQSLFNALF